MLWVIIRLLRLVLFYTFSFLILLDLFLRTEFAVILSKNLGPVYVFTLVVQFNHFTVNVPHAHDLTILF